MEKQFALHFRISMYELILTNTIFESISTVNAAGKSILQILIQDYHYQKSILQFI